MIKSLGKIAQSVDQRSEFSFGDINFFLEDITLLCLYIAKLKQPNCRRLFVGVPANSCYLKMGLGNVKKTCGKNKCLRQLRAKTPVVFLRKMNKVCTEWEFTFSQTSTSFSQ